MSPSKKSKSKSGGSKVVEETKLTFTCDMCKGALDEIDTFEKFRKHQEGCARREKLRKEAEERARKLAAEKEAELAASKKGASKKDAGGGGSSSSSGGSKKKK